MDDGIELADFLWTLRSELTRAMWGGENKDLRFKAEKVELELTVAAERSREPTAKVKLWVFDAGAGTKRTTTVTQVVRLTLQPVEAGAPDRPAIIAGNSFDNEE